MAKLMTTIGLVDQMTAPMAAIQNAISNLEYRFNSLDSAADIDSGTLTAMKNQLALTGAATQALADNMQLVQDEIQNANGGQKRLNDSLNAGQGAAGGLLGKIGAMAAAYAGIRTVKNVIGLADELTNTTARLNLMNDGLQSTKELQDMVYQSAQRSRSSYQATADTVAKLGITAKDAFSGNKEMIVFAEQMNKQFVIGGASVQEQSAAMYQLTQAMAAGRLQGDEFRSIMENAPLLAQSIADKMGLTVGELREASSQGIITADIIKSALFSAAEETDAKFANMPYTWAQIGQAASNTLLKAFQPVLQWIGDAAGWIRDNWSTIAPVFFGIATAVGLVAVGYGIWTAVTWLQVAANRALVVSLLSNPLMPIVIAIIAICVAIAEWIQSVGGIRIAWAIVVNALLTAWDQVKIGFRTGLYFVLNLWDKMSLGMRTAGTAIANFMGDMKANVLVILQNMVNGAIDIINGFIGMLNKIPGVNIGLIEQVSFGTNAKLAAEAEKQARNAALTAYKDEIAANMENRSIILADMKSDAKARAEERLAAIRVAQEENAVKEETAADNGYEDMLADISQNTALSADSLASANEYAEENVKLWRDIAERDTVNRFTTAEVSLSFGGINNHVAGNVDLDGMVNYLGERLEETLFEVAQGVGV